MEHQNEQIITVTGNGIMRITPDVTRLTIKIESLGITYSELYQCASENLTEIGNIVERHGLSNKLPKTIHFNIERTETRKYDDRNNFLGYEFNGYKLTQEIKVDLGMDTKLLSLIIQQIGEQIQDAQISIGYTVNEPRPAELLLLEKAVVDATEKAKIMAKTAGCKLGMVRNINYSVQRIEMLSEFNFNILAGTCLTAPKKEAALDFNPDDIEAQQKVTITWYLQ